MLIYVINNATKVYLPHNKEEWHPNLTIKVINSKKYAISVLTENKQFGGSFVKLGVRGNTQVQFVSSTIDEEILKDLICCHITTSVERDLLYKF